MALHFLDKYQQPMVRHALRINNAVEMVAFVLDDASVEPLDLALDHFAVEAGAAVADMQVSRHDAAQSRNRQAALPAERALPSDRLDHRVDQHRQILRDIARHVAETIAGDLKYHDPVGLMHL